MTICLLSEMKERESEERAPDEGCSTAAPSKRHAVSLHAESL